MSDNNDQSREMEPVTNGPPREAREQASEAASEQSRNGQAKAASPQKLAANRANAQHSTGPKTAEGKERSSQNSRTHGFYSRQFLPVGEEVDRLFRSYKDVVAGIWEYYEPVGVMEELLVEKIAAESIRFSRLLGYESDFVRETFLSDFVDRLLRFQGAINRQLFQSMRELERLQAIRKANS